MKKLAQLSFTARRIISGVIVALIVFSEANYYLWHLFGAADKILRALTLLVALVFFVGGGVSVTELRERREQRQRRT